MYVLKYVLEAALEISPQLPACNRYESTLGHVRKSRKSPFCWGTPFKGMADPSPGGRSIRMSQ